ncbi:MAG: hypothetical protein D6758_09880 [Gammaproteobacteria bacterium]|nr:MAG: hypothetical protein D6758_09880 [Gammaproteobacteria bacterium]
MKQALLALSLSMILIGCGSDGGGENDDGTRTGHLLFSGISGVHYETASQSGTTDSTGAFRYRPGETITFSIGSWIMAQNVQTKDWLSMIDFEADALAEVESGTLADCYSDQTDNDEELTGLIATDQVLQLSAHSCKEKIVAKQGNIANKLAFLLTLDSDRASENGISITQKVADAITQFEEQNPGVIDSIEWNASQNTENTDYFGNPENTALPEVRLINSICFPEQSTEVCEDANSGRVITNGNNATKFLVSELKAITRYLGEDVFLDQEYYEIPAGDTDVRNSNIRLIRAGRSIQDMEVVSSDESVVAVQSFSTTDPGISFYATGSKGQSATIFVNIRYEGDYRWIRKSVRVKII